MHRMHRALSTLACYWYQYIQQCATCCPSQLRFIRTKLRFADCLHFVLHACASGLCLLLLLLQENWHPLYNGGLSSNPVKAITEVPPEGLFQASYRCCCCCCCRCFWLCCLVVLITVCFVTCVGDVGNSVFQAASGSSAIAMVLLAHTLFSPLPLCVGRCTGGAFACRIYR